MITDTLCIETVDALDFFKAFVRVSALNHVVIDRVRHSPDCANYVFVYVSATSAGSFYSLGVFQMLFESNKAPKPLYSSSKTKN